MENIQNFRADLFSISSIFNGHFPRYIFLKKFHISNVNKGRGRGRLISYDIIWYHIIWCDIISYHMISYDIIWYHIIACDIIWYHIISYDIIWYHIIWYHIISYDMIRYTFGHVPDMLPKSFEGQTCFFPKSVGDLWAIIWHHRRCLRRGLKMKKFVIFQKNKVLLRSSGIIFEVVWPKN